jgi:hypothetical protein
MKEIERPSNGLAIRHYQSKTIQAKPVFRIGRTGHNPVNRKGRHRKRPAVVRRTHDLADCSLVIYGANANAENLMFSFIDHAEIRVAVVA